MSDKVLLVVGIPLLILVIYAGAIAVGLRLRRRLFAGPARDAWELARRDLSLGDRQRVRWATGRRRPVGRPALALPQLVYSRYVTDQAERSPLRRRPVRFGMAALYVGLAALQFAVGAVDQQSRVRDFVWGVLFVACAILFGTMMPRLLNRSEQKMKRLRRQVRERHPDW